jgi:hypothetical protein
MTQSEGMGLTDMRWAAWITWYPDKQYDTFCHTKIPYMRGGEEEA